MDSIMEVGEQNDEWMTLIKEEWMKGREEVDE